MSTYWPHKKLPSLIGLPMSVDRLCCGSFTHTPTLSWVVALTVARLHWGKTGTSCYWLPTIQFECYVLCGVHGSFHCNKNIQHFITPHAIALILVSARNPLSHFYLVELLIYWLKFGLLWAECYEHFTKCYYCVVLISQRICNSIKRFFAHIFQKIWTLVACGCSRQSQIVTFLFTQLIVVVFAQGRGDAKILINVEWGNVTNLYGFSLHLIASW